jgi:hypothetical protein
MQVLSPDNQPQPPFLVDTPFTPCTSNFTSPILASSVSSVDEILPVHYNDQQQHPFTDAQNISPDDIHSDPILKRLAKGQGLIAAGQTSDTVPCGRNETAFKAKPAPTNMMDRGVGPRLSKAAALRMGLEWDEKKGPGERRAIDFQDTPGHKRNNLSMV